MNSFVCFIFVFIDLNHKGLNYQRIHTTRCNQLLNCICRSQWHNATGIETHALRRIQIDLRK